MNRADLAAVVVILGVAVLMAGPGIATGGLGWSDAPNHVFDGIFVLEFIKDWPLGHAREWAEQFYLRFPALGIFVYYPPGFAAIEAAIFAIVGVNIFSARLAILCFAAGAAWMMYFLGRRWFDRPTGLLSALLLLTCPHGFLWMNDVMLEWPAMFWMLASTYCYQRFLDLPRARWAAGLAAVLVMAFMTKQTTGFILPVIVTHAAIISLQKSAGAQIRARLRSPAFVLSLGLAVAIIIAYVVASRRLTALPSQLLQISFDPFFYARHFPEIIGWPLLPVAVLGLLTLFFRRGRGVSLFVLLWFFAWLGFSSAISAKEPRYFFFALAPIAIVAVRFLLGNAFERPLSWRRDRARLALLGTLVLIQAVQARLMDTGPLPKYDGPVRELAGRQDADLVLVDAVRDGQFVFDVYQDKQARDRLITLRASKVLFARAARERYSYQQFVHSSDDILAILNKYSIRYIVIESAYPRTLYMDADPPPRKMLRELLTSDTRFRRIYAWPLTCGDPVWNGIELCLYEYTACPPRTSKFINLSFPAMGRDVTIQLP